MSRRRLNGVIIGSASIKAHLWDAIGAGICKIHGEYYGHGKYGLKDCPLCDIYAYHAPLILEQINFEHCGGNIP